jgi:exosortase/archaeosortase family protein
MRKFALDQSSAIRHIVCYAVALFGLASVIYYLPDYTILEAMVAEHSAGILNAIGVPAGTTIASNGAYVNNVQIVRECTGIQVVAVFAGLLLPLPKVAWQLKFKAIAVLGFAVYIANVIRVAVELWLLYAGIMPWSMAHGPFGTVLGVITVFLFFLVSDKFIPQIGNFLGTVADWIVNKYHETQKP